VIGSPSLSYSLSCSFDSFDAFNFFNLDILVSDGPILKIQ